MFINYIIILLGIGISIAVIFLLLVFFIRQSRKIRQQEKEIARMKQVQVEARIEKLRSKLSPHFLFNALNVLKSGTEDQWVKEYTVTLSYICRYLTGNKINQPLIPVQKELHFIDSYIYLLKARFGDQINIHISDDVRQTEAKIPPLTLQLLIENAVKHNTISIRNPLMIDILLEDDRITVRNPIAEKKLSGLTSGGTGLYNISERYRLISGKEIYIGNDGRYFTVKVPVFSKKQLREGQKLKLFG